MWWNEKDWQLTSWEKSLECRVWDRREEENIRVWKMERIYDYGNWKNITQMSGVIEMFHVLQLHVAGAVVPKEKTGAQGIRISFISLLFQFVCMIFSVNEWLCMGFKMFYF